MAENAYLLGNRTGLLLFVPDLHLGPGTEETRQKK